ncbi:MAG: hypothetical protein KBB71_11640, partial [Lentimicrobiaceae bacterium]|nr:hypothetical protein [Lentimicrobiaceae bacterium]
MMRGEKILCFILFFLVWISLPCGVLLAQIPRDQPVNLRPIVRLPDVIKESSGIVVTGPNEIWSHNDSGNPNKLYCFDTTGALIRTLEISNVANIDWEDLARDDQGNIYIDDAGNNDNDRTDLAIHIIANPGMIVGDETEAETIHFVFEDQNAFPPPVSNKNFDIEALVWHQDSLLLFTKNRSIPLNGYCKQYVLPAQPGQYIARLADSVYLGSTNDDARVTSAAVHPDSHELILLTQTKLVSFTHYIGNEVFRGEKNVNPFAVLPGQAEAVDFVGPDRVYITEEGSGGLSGYLYEARLPMSTGFRTLLPAEEQLRVKISGDRLILETGTSPVDFDEIYLFDVMGCVRLTGAKTHILCLDGIPDGYYVVLTVKDGR